MKDFNYFETELFFMHVCKMFKAQLHKTMAASKKLQKAVFNFFFILISDLCIYGDNFLHLPIYW